VLDADIVYQTNLIKYRDIELPYPGTRRMVMKRGNYAKHAAIWGLGGPSRSREIEFYSILAKKYGNKVLSLMCATGEIAYGMAKNGLRVTAVDIEPEMIAAAKKNYPGNTNPCFLTGDVTDLHLPDKDYAFAFIGTGDFHHLLSEKEMLVALICIRKHLTDKGCLALELFYPRSESFQSPKRRFDPPHPPETDLKTWKLGETSYDADTMREHIKQEIFIEEQGRIVSFLHEFELQLVSRETLVGLLEKAGFKITAEYGGFDFSVWHPGADKWIVASVKVNNEMND
jgi:SAM-dependent methyltransferase